MSKNKIFFRADGNSQMGLGHVIRSLALAHMLKEEFECIFLIRTPSSYLSEEILKVCNEMIELPHPQSDLEEAELLSQQYLGSQAIIILDGYHFDTAYQQILKKNTAWMVCIDDIHKYHFISDLLINHAPGIASDSYSGEAYTSYYLGMDYSLLRPPFLKAAATPRSFNQIDTAFICFGGADSNNITLKCLKALAQQNWVQKVHIVLGGANNNKAEIVEFLSDQEVLEVSIHQKLSAQEMVEVMSQCQLGIVPASSILYEVICVQMMIISGYYVDNQKQVYKGFNQLGLLTGIGDFNTFSDFQQVFDQIKTQNFSSVLDRQHRQLYGQSKANFLEIFKNIDVPKQSPLTYRRAEIKDLQLYFDWANETGVRQQSLNQTSIAIEDHSNWFRNKLQNENSILYLFYMGQEAVGQVRFEIEDATAIINYSLDVNMRGKGLGKRMLKLAMQTIMKESIGEINAFSGVVKKDNIPSRKIFEKLEFIISQEKLIQGTPCLVFINKIPK